jgi:hypothetical protein
MDSEQFAPTNRSLQLIGLLDVYILAATVQTVVTGEGDLTKQLEMFG